MENIQLTILETFLNIVKKLRKFTIPGVEHGTVFQRAKYIENKTTEPETITSM